MVANMAELGEGSDRPLLDLIRRRGPLTVSDMAAAFSVTQTAVRNRLARLVASGLVETGSEPHGRGRPKLTYRASDAAHRKLGQNYADLALALWEEMMTAIEDPKLRRRLFQRVTDRLAEHYRSQLSGDRWQGRLVQLGSLLHARGIEVEVVFNDDQSLPVLRQYSCPYFELAGVDESVCALERRMLEKVLGHSLRLSTCRLDGDRACQFESKPGVGH